MHPSAASRLLRLSELESGAFVMKPLVDGAAADHCSPLPRLPMSLAQWLSALGERFWEQQRGACLAAVLMVDPSRKRWIPVIPTQRCGRRRPRWRLRHQDLITEDAATRVAGSFQTLCSPTLSSVADAVPEYDGIHLVQRQDHGSADERDLLIFLRVGGDTQLATPAAILTDDLRDTLQRNAERMQVSR